MDSNFDEQRAWQDLREILSHMYGIAGNFYSELQAAQTSIREKDRQIAVQTANHENEVTALNDKISELERSLVAQEETFREHLIEYGKRNDAIAEQLKNLKINLDERERKLHDGENKLELARASFDGERRQFENERANFNNDRADFDDLKNQAGNFDEQIHKLKLEYQSQIDKLKFAKAAAEQTIKDLRQENSSLTNEIGELRSQAASSESIAPNETPRAENIYDEGSFSGNG